MIQTSRLDEVSVLTMKHGKANALDVELCRALRDAVDAAAASGAEAVVLSGSGRIFSAGVDLFRVIDGGEAYVTQLLAELRETFTHLASFELPLVAAVNGHAIAGGFVLMAAADRAILAEGAGRVGVTELLVGVPFPMVALELVRARAGDPQTATLALSGLLLEAEAALNHGLVDELAPAEALLDRAVAEARRLASLGPAFSVTKRQLRIGLIDRIRRGAEMEADVDAVWRAPETLDRIKRYMASLELRAGA